MKLNSIPADDGFFMPAEFASHQASIMIFPERPGSWGYGAEPAQAVFAEIIREIAKDEQVYVIVSEKTKKKAGGVDCLLPFLMHLNVLGPQFCSCFGICVLI